jgi:hypothetical protein
MTTPNPSPPHGYTWADLTERPAETLAVGDTFVAPGFGDAWFVGTDGSVWGAGPWAPAAPGGTAWTVLRLDASSITARSHDDREATETPKGKVLLVNRPHDDPAGTAAATGQCLQDADGPALSAGELLLAALRGAGHRARTNWERHSDAEAVIVTVPSGGEVWISDGAGGTAHWPHHHHGWYAEFYVDLAPGDEGRDLHLNKQADFAADTAAVVAVITAFVTDAAG